MRSLQKYGVGMLVSLALLAGCSPRRLAVASTAEQSSTAVTVPSGGQDGVSNGGTVEQEAASAGVDTEESASSVKEALPEKEAGAGFNFAAPVTGDDSPQVEWTGTDDTAALYIYDSEAGQYREERFKRPEKATLLQLAAAVSERMGYTMKCGDNPAQIRSVRQEKGMVIVDFKADFIPKLGLRDGDVSPWLNSIARTLLENHNGAEAVGFTSDGGQFSVADVTLEADGYGRYDPPELYANADTDAGDF